MGKLEINYNGNKNIVYNNQLLKNIICLSGIFELFNRKNLEVFKLDFVYGYSEFDLTIKPDQMREPYKKFIKNMLSDIINNRYAHGFIDGLKE